MGAALVAKRYADTVRQRYAALTGFGPFAQTSVDILQFLAYFKALPQKTRKTFHGVTTQ